MLRSALSRHHSSHRGETQVTWRHQQGQEVALSAAIPRESQKSGGKTLDFLFTRDGGPSQFNLNFKEEHDCSWHLGYTHSNCERWGGRLCTPHFTE